MKKYSIDVNLSRTDIEELFYDADKEFNWSWVTKEDDNVHIDIKLFQEEDLEEVDRVEEILKGKDEAMQRFTNRLNEKESE